MIENIFMFQIGTCNKNRQFALELAITINYIGIYSKNVKKFIIPIQTN